MRRASKSEQTEREFLTSYDASAFERPSVAVDIVVLTASRGGLRAVVVQRHEHPSRGKYALPGGFVRLDESLDDAARRLLRDKAGLEGIFIEQLYTFGAPKRDPRMRIITVAYYALVHPKRFDELNRTAGARVASLVVPWEGEVGGPISVCDEQGVVLPIAFDHTDILGMAVKRIRGKLDYAPIGHQLLPDAFTLRALQDVHEAVRGERLNKDSFRRRMLASGLLEATGDREQDVVHRPAELYRFRGRAAI